MAGIMSLNSTACLLVLSFLTQDVNCRNSDTSPPMRYGRDSVQEYMGDDPNFWPVRGRRAGDPTKRGDRRFREEGNGVFWAGRGRDLNGDDEPWKDENRLWRGDDTYGYRLSAEEPGWVWLVRREPTVRPAKLDDFCSFNANRNAKREIFRQKLCHLKRKSNNLLRDIPQADQFWPLRGKKAEELPRGKRPTKALPNIMDDEQFWPLRGKREEESWQDGLRDLKTFWPARGRREESNHDKDGKEVT